MEENKKPTVLIVLLILAGLCLVGLGVWSGMKYFKGEENKLQDETSSNSVNQIGERIDFPQKSDDSVTTIRFYELFSESERFSNFSNLKKEKNGNTFVYNCEKYEKDEGYSKSTCRKVKLTINGELTIYEEESMEKGINEIYISGSYYVLYYSDLYMNYWFDIYNKSNKVYSSDWTVREFYGEQEDFNYTNQINTKPVIINNILHFVEIDSSHKDKPHGYLSAKYNTIDLNADKLEVKTIKTFNGYFQSK